jgi:plastocyanin
MSGKAQSTLWRNVAMGITLAGLVACGGGDDNGGGGGGGGNPMGPSGGPGPSGATITIGANGAISPTSVTITTGQSVTFVNNDSRVHNMASDPHPAHTNCPSINAIGVIANGQTKLTNSFSSAGTCGFHDHDDPGNNSLQGTIRIQ